MDLASEVAMVSKEVDLEEKSMMAYRCDRPVAREMWSDGGVVTSFVGEQLHPNKEEEG